MSPGAVWLRAVRRVDRRAATVRALRPAGYANAPIFIGDPVWSHCADCERALLLLREAVRTANSLAHLWNPNRKRGRR